MTLIIYNINGEYFEFKNYISAEMIPYLVKEPTRYMLKVIDKDRNIIFFNMEMIIYFTEKKEERNEKRTNNIVLVRQKKDM